MGVRRETEALNQELGLSPGPWPMRLHRSCWISVSPSMQCSHTIPPSWVLSHQRNWDRRNLWGPGRDPKRQQGVGMAHLGAWF
jgi:hypothetical protein